jgi:hypothetical protein
MVVFLLDFDSYPDLIPGLIFVAIGLGLLFSRVSSRRHRRILAGLVVVCVVTNVVFVLLFGGVFGTYTIEAAEPLSQLASVTHGADDPYPVVGPDVRYLYWNQIESNTCHIRLSINERRWISLSGKELLDKQCGDLDRALRVLRQR